MKKKINMFLEASRGPKRPQEASRSSSRRPEVNRSGLGEAEAEATTKPINSLIC